MWLNPHLPYMAKSGRNWVTIRGFGHRVSKGHVLHYLWNIVMSLMHQSKPHKEDELYCKDSGLKLEIFHSLFLRTCLFLSPNVTSKFAFPHICLSVTPLFPGLPLWCRFWEPAGLFSLKFSALAQVASKWPQEEGRTILKRGTLSWDE